MVESENGVSDADQPAVELEQEAEDVSVVLCPCEGRIILVGWDVEVDGGVIYRDGLMGQILDSKLVRVARQKELDFSESKHV